MKIKSVRSFKLPAYPTRLQIVGNPELLGQNIPRSWLTGKEVAGVLAVFLAANIAAAPGKRDTGRAGTAAVVAPVFEHGAGRGSVGCTVVSPPLFLSEEEAMSIVTEELSRAGLHVSVKNVPLGNVTIAPRVQKTSQEGGYHMDVITMQEAARPLIVDAMDPQKRVAVEFVSRGDYFELGGPKSATTLQGFDFKDVANELSQQVAKKGRGIYFGAFYDPLYDPSFKSRRYSECNIKVFGDKPNRQNPTPAQTKAFDECNAETNREFQNLPESQRVESKDQAMKKSKEMLRLQVKDFVDWLKAQGAI